MKVAITGASGYVGACLAASFRSKGHEVLSLSRRPCPMPWLSYSLGDNPHSLPWQDVDVLIHAAYDFLPSGWQQVFEKNVVPSVALLKTAKDSGVQCVIFISSMSAYPGCRSDYGKAKVLIENKVLELGGMVLRPGLVWGESSGGVMGTLEKMVAKFPVVPFLVGARSIRQWLIHQSDLAEATVAFAGPAFEPGEIRSLAQPIPVSLLNILKTIARRTRTPRFFLPIPWQCVWIGLKVAARLRIYPPFRCDSLIGLVHGNPKPTFHAPLPALSCRPFS